MAALITATAGLLLGKFKEQDYLKAMYARTDFTLLDDKNNFFQLSKFPDSRLLLLVFTPDGIHPDWVKPFRKFSAHLGDFQALGIDVMMISRTNREIARNFKEASLFRAPLLVDPGGTVGRLIGVWPDLNPVSYWGYALLDNRMQLYWSSSDIQPMSYERLIEELKKVGAQLLEKQPAGN